MQRNEEAKKNSQRAERKQLRLIVEDNTLGSEARFEAIEQHWYYIDLQLETIRESLCDGISLWHLDEEQDGHEKKDSRLNAPKHQTSQRRIEPLE